MMALSLRSGWFIAALFLCVLLCVPSLVDAQTTEVLRNDMYRYDVRSTGDAQVFFIEEIQPVTPEEVRLPRRLYRIPLDGAAPFDVVLQSVRLSEAIDATPFYTMEMSWTADSTVRTRVIPYDGAITDPAIGRGAEVLARRIVYERRQPVLEIELPLLLWDAATQRMQWVEEYTLARVPSDGIGPAVQQEEKPPYMSQPFTTRSKNVDTSQVWIDENGSMVKFFVRRDGLYRINADWLRDAGADPAMLDPARIQLYRKGVAIPMHAVGLEDGNFDEEDYFIFHGTRNYDERGYRHLVAHEDDPYPQYMSIYTDSTAYWLHFNHDDASRATTQPPMLPLPPDTLDWTYETLHIEYDPSNFLLPHTTDLIRGQMPAWTSEDTWCMAILTLEAGKAPSIGYNPKFRVDEVFPGADARYWYKLVSWYGDRFATPNHAVAMRLNGGEVLDSVVFNHDQQALLFGSEPASSLLVGENNVLGITSWNISTSSSSLRVDWLDIEYPRFLRVGGPSRIFRIDSVFAAGQWSVKLRDVQTPDPFVLRVRGDGTSAVLPAAAASPEAPHTVWLAADLQPGDELYVWNADSIPLPGRGASLSIPRLDEEEAEYLIVTAPQFESTTREYADFISTSYDVSTRVVFIDDIYDRYSYGMFQPEAIKLLTFDLYYGQQADSLKYLFLIGDANYNYKASYSPNIVPSYGNPVSDVWYVAFDSLTSVPSFEVGRLPVREEGWVRQYLDRHRDYREQEKTLWNKSTLHFSGGNLSGGENELRRYKTVNDIVISTVVEQPPFAGRTAHFYKTLEPQSDFGPLPLPEVRERIAEGGVFICYVGHSGTQTWDNSISRTDQLENSAGRASLITDFGCSTGRFAEPDYFSFSELFVTGENSHAIAYIGNSAAGFDLTATVLPRYFFNELITGGASSIGDAHHRTRIRLGPSNIVTRVSIQTNLLFGDPVVELDLPKLPNPIVRDSWLRPEMEIVTDVMDSLAFNIVVGNYGLQTPDSLDILAEHYKDGTMTGSIRLTRPLPALYDTLQLSFDLSGEAGNGLLRITLDPDDKIEEISEGDNIAVLDYRIFSTFLKVVNDRLGTVSARGSDITVLNPMFDPGAVNTITVESDRTPLFNSPERATFPYTKTMSRGDAPALFPEGEKRYWRVKLDAAGQDFVGPFLRRDMTAPADFVQADSTEFLSADFDFVRFDSAITFPPGRQVELLGSGFSLGNAVHIKIDGNNVLPTSIASAYCIAVVDSATLNVKRIALFNNYSVPAHRDSIRRWAEEVEFGEYFMVTTGNEPKAGSHLFIDEIRALGSKYIDSVLAKGWRPSWAFIGRRGAPVGTMPEAYFSEASRIPAVIDTTFYVAPDTGWVTSPPVGPASVWHGARLERSDPAISDIRLFIYGVRDDQQEVLLMEAGNITEVDLSGIDASAWPYIRLRAGFYPESGDPLATKLHAWSVDYTQPPELALNYQSVAMPIDSVQQGAPAEIAIGILNAGEGDADVFPVHLEVVGSDNIPRSAGNFSVSGLTSGQWFDTTAVINTDFLSGPYQVFVRVDRDESILEQYKDNNTYVASLYVKPDTSRPRLDVTFDGFMPLDNDYIRYNPEIVIQLYSDNPVPVTSRENFTITLDGDEMDLDSIGFTMIPATRDRPATLRFQPLLSDGIYYFGFNAEDAKQTSVYDEVLEIRVRVSTKSRIAEVYNYPNPFYGETSFTFLLTGMEAPQEAEIKIYTVAGRLIRKVSYPASSMRIGYNALKWDGRDEDGDELANGVYFYKIIARFTDETFEHIGRMAVMR
ncbi:MAG: hypothetical protein KFH87_14480 [Bacteroidetes bacterium]|nr:hypothetical protein [Bacteroidota bacterium]